MGMVMIFNQVGDVQAVIKNDRFHRELAIASSETLNGSIEFVIDGPEVFDHCLHGKIILGSGLVNSVPSAT